MRLRRSAEDSNLLVADEGVEGLVIRVHGGDVRALEPSRIRVDAGVTINGLVRWTVGRGLSGIEAWAGTPGTVGGAVFGNAHFQGRLMSELVRQVRVVSADGLVTDIDAAAMEFGYDFSRLHRTGEVVVSADLRGVHGGAGRAARGRPRVARLPQAYPAAGVAERGLRVPNPSPGDPVPDGIPPSAGALVDRAGLKGARSGRALVSPAHANFIVNEGGATAAEIRALIDRCQAEVQARFGVTLREEVVYLGFRGSPHA